MSQPRLWSGPSQKSYSDDTDYSDSSSSDEWEERKRCLEVARSKARAMPRNRALVAEWLGTSPSTKPPAAGEAGKTVKPSLGKAAEANGEASTSETDGEPEKLEAGIPSRETKRPRLAESSSKSPGVRRVVEVLQKRKMCTPSSPERKSRALKTRLSRLLENQSPTSSETSPEFGKHRQSCALKTRLNRLLEDQSPTSSDMSPEFGNPEQGREGEPRVFSRLVSARQMLGNGSET